MIVSPFFPEIERSPVGGIRKFQETKLQQQLIYLKEKSKYYSDHFRRNRIDISRIRSLDDLVHIPPTTKDDLQQRNDEFICVPKDSIIDYITTSGTMGDPVTFAMTDKDLDRLAYNEAISFICADGSATDIYQLMTTIDRRFMAGLAYFMGIRRMGAGVVRVGNGVPEFQWDTIGRVHPTAIIAVPSFILKIIEYAEAHHIDYRNSSIRKAICIGEPLRNNDFTPNTLGRRILEKWPIRLYSTYASTEMGTSFTECGEGVGGHHHPELIIIEFLDDQNQPVKVGECGEVTITTLGVEGMPLLRFKTGDVCQRHSDPCKCGRTTLRLGPVIGRKNQMIKYKGTSLYPPSLYDILDDLDFISIYVIEVYTNEIGTDEILIHVGSRNPVSGREKEIKDHFRAKLRVAPLIKFETEENIHRIQFPGAARKPVKFVDNRDKSKNNL
jgi:phenylacetate-CoA ligase